MDTTTHIAIQTDEGSDFVRPVSLSFSQPAPGEPGEWMVVAFSERANDIRGFRLLGIDASNMVDSDVAELERIVAAREAAPEAVEVVAEPQDTGEVFAAAGLTPDDDSE